MQIVAISDIHGNYEFLYLAWSKITKLGLNPKDTKQPILNAGDTVSYGPDTNDCIDFVKYPENMILSVSGNYDKNVAAFPEKEDSFRRKWGAYRPDKFEAIRDASDQLTSSNREWLADLPKTINVELLGVKFLVNHYRPVGEKSGLFDTTPDSEFERIADNLSGRAQVVITGHTHTPYVKSISGVLFVNPGSVGRPLYTPTFAVIDVDETGECSGEIVECLD